jgi:Ca2+-transporting ATPase
LPSAQRRKWRHIARETLQEPMFMLLLAAGTLYLLSGDLHEGLVVLAMTL